MSHGAVSLPRSLEVRWGTDVSVLRGERYRAGHRMAVDADVLIFERIREELAGGGGQIAPADAAFADAKQPTLEAGWTKDGFCRRVRLRSIPSC